MSSTPSASAVQPPTNNTAYNILARAHPASKATSIFTDKIKNKPLLLQPSHTNGSSSGTDKRSLRRHIRLRKKQYLLQHQKPRPLSAKEKRQLGIYKLKPDEIKYDIYRGLNALWRGYILEVLGLTDGKTGALAVGGKSIGQASHGSLLASADFHGMQVEVVRCVDVGRVGLKGIVVRETRSVLVVVTERDKLVKIPKRGAVFRVVIPLTEVDGRHCGPSKGDHGKQDRQVPQEEKSDTAVQDRQIVLELHGSQLEIRPVERAVKKFKWKTIDYL